MPPTTLEIASAHEGAPFLASLRVLRPFAASVWGTSLHRVLLALITAAVFAMDLSQPAARVSLGYLAVVLLSMRLTEPRAPLYASLASIVLTHLASISSPAAAEVSLIHLDRGLISLALLTSGAICHLLVRSRIALRDASIQTATSGPKGRCRTSGTASLLMATRSKTGTGKR